MYASIRRYKGNPDQMSEMLHLADEDFAESIQEIDGFVAYEMIDEGDGRLTTVSLFRDRSAAEASVEAAAAWVRDNLASRFEIERLEVITGEVMVSRARREVLEPAHA